MAWNRPQRAVEAHCQFDTKCTFARSHTTSRNHHGSQPIASLVAWSIRWYGGDGLGRLGMTGSRTRLFTGSSRSASGRPIFELRTSSAVTSSSSSNASLFASSYVRNLHIELSRAHTVGHSSSQATTPFRMDAYALSMLGVCPASIRPEVLNEAPSVLSEDSPKPTENSEVRSFQERRPWEQDPVERNFVNDIPDWIGKGDNSPVWPLYNRKAKEIHESTIEGWDKNMDVLLVFSALFSAVVTAFFVSSMTLLSADTSQQAINALATISAQLAAMNALASLAPTAYQTPESFVPSTSAIMINMLWALSLTISLYASVLAMLVKAWLHNYGTGLSSAPAEQARQRYWRYDCLVDWNVPAIVSALPIMLHVAVFVFLVGLLLFLWPSSTALTARMAVVWIVGGIVYFLLALGPVLRTRCPYTSPLTAVLARIVLRMRRFSKAHHNSCLDPGWLAQRVSASIAHDQVYLDTCLMGWLERACTDEREKESVLCASFGWQPHKVFERFEHNFAATATHAVSRLLKPTLGPPYSWLTESSHLLLRLAVFTTYGEEVGEDSTWATLSTQSWAEAALSKSTNSAVTTAWMGILLWASSNHRSWWEEDPKGVERVERIYAIVVPEFCRALELPTAPLSLVGSWLLIEHLRRAVERLSADPSSDDSAAHHLARLEESVPALRPLFAALPCFIASSKSLPACFLASMQTLWTAKRLYEGDPVPSARILSPGHMAIYPKSQPPLQQVVAWSSLLATGTPRAGIIASTAYITHNPVESQSQAVPEEKNEWYLLYGKLIDCALNTSGLTGALYPTHSGHLLGLLELKAKFPFEFWLLQNLLNSQQGPSTLEKHDVWPLLLQLVDLWSDGTQPSLGISPDALVACSAWDRSSVRYSICASNAFSELVRCARGFRDPRSAIVTTWAINEQLTKLFGGTRTSEQTTITSSLVKRQTEEWAEAILQTGWIDMLVEYVYEEVLRVDSKYCKMMQKAIRMLEDHLIPHLGKLGRLVLEHPPPNMIHGFKEQMLKAVAYSPPPPPPPMSTISKLGNITSLLHPQRWLRLQPRPPQILVPDVELGALTVPEEETPKAGSRSTLALVPTLQDHRDAHEGSTSEKALSMMHRQLFAQNEIPTELSISAQERPLPEQGASVRDHGADPPGRSGGEPSSAQTRSGKGRRPQSRQSILQGRRKARINMGKQAALQE
ncbi:hypothetical protein CALCODRAFT_248722 [Calocera cornea HHB12733]|uniref:DUF6535 domain-containing protein n=1 Tax=Calocera cornea HHB12733 TaxID=1353952 RepID=A0A165JVM6_9BASI|nr:hypothetical protein CALCODRAFT_248722 [Calocera cornea HHB12733]